MSLRSASDQDMPVSSGAGSVAQLYFVLF